MNFCRTKDEPISISHHALTPISVSNPYKAILSITIYTMYSKQHPQEIPIPTKAQPHKSN